MKKYLVGLTGVMVAAVLAGVLVVGVDKNSKGRVESAATASLAVSVSPAAKPLSYQGVDGKTALELLQEEDATATVKGEGANAYVTGIGKYTADESKKEYWALYVNGTMSQVGAGSYVTKNGDTIEWKLEKF